MGEHSNRRSLQLNIRLTKEEISDFELTFIDCAPSNKISKIKASGTQLKEAAYIGKELGCLGLVLGSLRKSKAFVPYRDSCLTYLNQHRLMSHQKYICVNIEPTESEIEETISTLGFVKSVCGL